MASIRRGNKGIPKISKPGKIKAPKATLKVKNVVPKIGAVRQPAPIEPQ